MNDRERLAEALKIEIDRVRSAPEAPNDRGRLRELVSESLIDVADLAVHLDDEDRLLIFESLGPEEQADLLEEVEGEVRDYFLRALDGDERLPHLLERIAPDDAVDLVEDLSQSDRDRILDNVETQHADKIRELSQYAPDTAGGLMTPDFVATSQEATVADVKTLIRSRDDFESIDNVFVLSKERLLGVFSSRDLILADNSDLVKDLMTTDVVSAKLGTDREECYRLMETYHLSTLPVVDQFHDLAGIVTVDDVLTVGQEEASEDVFRMAGSADIRPTRDSVLGRVRKRLPYLLVSVFGGFGSALVLKLFSVGDANVISEVTYFLPMIAMLGGNIATQSSAVMVRGFATGEIDPHHIPRVIGDELQVGVLVGVVCSVFGAIAAYVLGENDPLWMALAVMASIASLSGISSVLGTTIPSVCHKLNVDPAISAGPFITMLIDMIGCAIYMAFVIGFGAHLVD
ncbi:MAG: magnesium transporter [Planctomycetota bacterium]